MAIQRLVRPALLLAGGALTLVMTAACQGNFNAQGNWSDNGTTSNVAANGQAGNATQDAATSGSGTTAHSGLPECKAGNLKLTIGQGNGGAGSVYEPIQFTNVSKTSCVMVGFPGVSFVGGNDGHQIGSPATRTGSIGRQFTLTPGSTASAQVKVANAANFDSGECQAVPARGFRVYAPDDTAAMFVPFTGGDQNECGNAKDGQLQVQAVMADATTASTTTPRCHTADLTAHLGQPAYTTPNGGFITGRVDVVYTNTSGHTCTMYGFGGVDLHGPHDPNGPVDSLRRGETTQLDPSDPRYVPAAKPTMVTLTPGATAHTQITFASNTKDSGNVGSNGSVTWLPTSVAATPPDETTSVTLPWVGANVFRDDSATVALTYISPVQPGA